jgi:hypothetical protein
MSKRKKWPAAEKLRIVLAGMQPNVEVSELCRRGKAGPGGARGRQGQLRSCRLTPGWDGRDDRQSASGREGWLGLP